MSGFNFVIPVEFMLITECILRSTFLVQLRSEQFRILLREGRREGGDIWVPYTPNDKRVIHRRVWGGGGYWIRLTSMNL